MSFEEIFKNQPFWTLTAVFFGFMLGEGTRFIRDKFKIRRFKRAIKKELESVKYQIFHKKDIVSQIINHLENKRLLSGLSVLLSPLAMKR